MKAVAYKTPGPIDRGDALEDITLEIPKAEGRDLLVKIIAVSVNPVDAKLRQGKAPEGDDWKVLGFDAAGVVEAVGPEVQNFKPVDAVYYSGSFVRPGTNSEYHLVDERIVGNKPSSLSDPEAAALPLTAITAWEMMFTRSLFGTPDMAEQGKLLNEVAALVDAGSIRSTVTEVAGMIDAATLRAVHAKIETGTARGKVVLEGF